MTISSLFIVGLLACGLNLSDAWAVRDVAELPRPADPVGVLDPDDLIPDDQQQGLTAKLRGFADRSGNQIGVVVVARVEGQNHREFANLLFEQWELGEKGKDNGLLILLAIEDRRVEFETGYGLEGDLPDVTCFRIQQDYMLPLFRQGDFYAGLEAGVDAVISTLETGVAPTPTHTSSDHQGQMWPQEVFGVVSHLQKGEYEAGLEAAAALVSNTWKTVVAEIVVDDSKKHKAPIGWRGVLTVWGIVILLMLALWRKRRGGKEVIVAPTKVEPELPPKPGIELIKYVISSLWHQMRSDKRSTLQKWTDEPKMYAAKNQGTQITLLMWSLIFIPWIAFMWTQDVYCTYAISLGVMIFNLGPRLLLLDVTEDWKAYNLIVSAPIHPGLVIFFPFPFLFVRLWDQHRLGAYRRRIRGEGELVPLEERSTYLNEFQLKEEELKTASFDVWRKDGEVYAYKALSYTSSYQQCTACQSVARKRTWGGTMCLACGVKTKDPRGFSSGSGGGSSSGGSSSSSRSGGGRSGGGGAGSSW